MRTMKYVAISGALMITLAGCANNRAPEVLPDAPDGGEYNGGNTNGNVGNAIIPGSEADFIRSIESNTVYFDTDRYNIDGADQAVLASQARWLAQYPQVRVTIEGHADERGTRDYNLALGERRANAARNYLASLGVDPSRIMVVSYGKERPIALGSDEASWAQNRRAVTVTIQR
jgi:peptidoglycan-associated lipoprotein